jgi:hypothetical protein
MKWQTTVLLCTLGMALCLTISGQESVAQEDPTLLERGTKFAIQKALTFVLPADTTVGSLRWKPKQGILTIRDLNIKTAGVPGFADALEK